MPRSASFLRAALGTVLALSLVAGGSLVDAPPAASAAPGNSVTFSKIASKTAPYKGKATIKPNVKKTGKVVISKKTLTVKQGSKTIAKNKTSVKLKAGTYKVTQKVTYRTYAVKTVTQKVKKVVVGVPAWTDVTVQCTANNVSPESDAKLWVNASCTSPKFDGAYRISLDLYTEGDGTWWGVTDDYSDELTALSTPIAGEAFNGILNAGDDLMKTKIVEKKVSKRVYSKVKTKTSTSQKLVIKKGKKPSSVPGTGGYNCPSGYPIKGNADSGIYHVPGGRYYKATKPEECFATEAAAKAAGYRKSKV